MEQKRKKKRVKILYHRVAAAVLVLVLLVSGGYLLWKHLDYQKGAEDYQAAVAAAGIPQWIKPPDRSGSSQRSDPYASALAETDLEALREVNPDVVGWIMIPDTVLSYPVVQGTDNRYYLNHTWMGERSGVGAIFMEYTNASDLSGFNTILYGHRMNNESMFGVLKSYESMDFWKDHPTVYLVSDSGVHTYDIFAAHEVGIKEIVYRLDLEESGLEQEFIDFCLERSEIDTGVIPSAADKVLTLSTCTGRGHATRWVVQAVLREN